MTREVFTRDQVRDAARSMLLVALQRWNVDQQIGSAAGLSQWVDEFVEEELGDRDA